MQMAERMIACVTAYDSVSRLGADEFAIVLSNIAVDTHSRCM
ncbi:MAG TPA: diguanylate cyclase [Steroidobacteraceae bacterium]